MTIPWLDGDGAGAVDNRGAGDDPKEGSTNQVLAGFDEANDTLVEIDFTAEKKLQCQMNYQTEQIR